MEYKGQTLIKLDGAWRFANMVLAASHTMGQLDWYRLDLWLEHKEARECTAEPCLGKVLWGKAHKCGFGRRNWKHVCKAISEHYEWFDHYKLFWLPAERQYIMTAQPYSVSLESFKEMELFAAKHKLEVDISIADAWWFPGATPLIIWRAAAPQQERQTPGSLCLSE